MDSFNNLTKQSNSLNHEYQEPVRKRKQIKYVLTSIELVRLDIIIKKLNIIESKYIKLTEYSRIDSLELSKLKEETSNVLISLGDLTINDLWINKRHVDFYYYVDNVKDFAWDLFETIEMKMN